MNSVQRITHVLNRLSLGTRPDDRQQFERNSVDAYIQAQLNPTGLSEPAFLAKRLRQLSTLKLSPVELFEQYAVPLNNSSLPETERKSLRQRQRQVLQEAIQARLLRAVASPRQLQEVMVDFWFNHFNVFVGKGPIKLWAGVYEQTAIRPHALGKFRDLLGATAKHPAMLFYLDNWRNIDPNSDYASRLSQGLNENYARELMELHTLGVNSGYTQADVESLTRILTGWGLVKRRKHSSDGSGFKFFPKRHDTSDKVLIGQTIAGGGMDEIETALDILARHPATAHHIGYKLAQYFVADTPPDNLVKRLADRFLATDGDIRNVLSTLFKSPDFWDSTYYQRKFKTPYQYLISLARATGMTSPSQETLRRLTRAMQQLGMPLYRCQTPDGYSQVKTTWLSPDAMLRRVSFAIGAAQLAKKDNLNIAVLLQALDAQLSPKTRTVIDSAPVHLRHALILGSPDMMYR